MWLKTETQEIQNDLAMFCRSGEEVKIPGTIRSRLPHYRRLVYSNVNDAMENAFPIMKSYVPEEKWAEMVYEFFAHHKCSTPLLWQLPYEFYTYARENNFAGVYDMPWLNDLMLFEWLEVELFMMEDVDYPPFKEYGDIFNNVLVANPESRLTKFNFPVHKRGKDNLDSDPGDYFLLMFREKDSGKVQFVSLSVLFALAVNKILNDPKPLNVILKDIALLFDIGDEKSLFENAEKFVADLQNKGFIIGYS